MLVFPLSLLLVPYAIIVAIFLLFAALNVLHLVHYGETTHVSFILTAVFFLGTVLVVSVTWFALSDVDWTRPVSVGFAQHAPSIANDGFGF